MVKGGGGRKAGVGGWGDGEHVCLSVYGRSVRLPQSHALGDPDSDRPLTVCLLSFISHFPSQDNGSRFLTS